MRLICLDSKSPSNEWYITWCVELLMYDGIICQRWWHQLPGELGGKLTLVSPHWFVGGHLLGLRMAHLCILSTTHAIQEAIYICTIFYRSLDATTRCTNFWQHWLALSKHKNMPKDIFCNPGGFHNHFSPLCYLRCNILLWSLAFPILKQATSRNKKWE